MESLKVIIENEGCWMIDCADCNLFDGTDCELETNVKRECSNYIFCPEQFLPVELDYVKQKLCDLKKETTMDLDNGIFALLKSDIEDVILEYLYKKTNKKNITKIFDEITQLLYKHNLYNDEYNDFRPVYPDINVTYDVVFNDDGCTFTIELIDYNEIIEIIA